jgi:hypothetical protein
MKRQAELSAEIAEIIIDMGIKLSPSLVSMESISLNKLGKLTSTQSYISGQEDFTR